MTSVLDLKTQTIPGTPVLLFDCALADGAVERWCTQSIQIEDRVYSPRVLRHNVFELQSGSELTGETSSRVTLVLANADSRLSQLLRRTAWKGAALTVQFVFWDVVARQPATDGAVVFKGICNPPEEITESFVRLTFTSRLSMQRLLLPSQRIQRVCPWTFPRNAAQREEAVRGDRYSPFYACGYAPGAVGNFGPNGPYQTCDGTRSQCMERGMFDKDNAGHETRRFGGIQYVPSTITVRTHGQGQSHQSAVIDNQGKYNDLVPLIYGMAWYRPPVIFARSDGNLTHMEVLLGSGVIEGVERVLVNGTELPSGTATTRPTATGWYNLLSRGTRNGSFNPSFTNGAGEPLGDPYGSTAVMSVVIPDHFRTGNSQPRVEVLLRGIQCATFDESGTFIGQQFTNNPAWVLLDVLRRARWSTADLDLRSFALSAAYCSESIEVSNLSGERVERPRFQCNLVLRARRSAADVIRGIRTASGLQLSFGSNGLLQLTPESSFAVQQPLKLPYSNSSTMLNGGWPAYEFGDGSSDFSDILRKPDGTPAVRLSCRSSAESPNRYSLEFQDEFNDFQQDSLSLVDAEDSLASGVELSAPSPALGVANFEQAARILRLALDKSIRGNLYVEFETGLRALGLRAGDLITLTYAKEGFDRQPFRILKIQAGRDFATFRVIAQVHEDGWYTGANGSTGLTGGGRLPQPAVALPRPLVGTILNDDGSTEFDLKESYFEQSDGTWAIQLDAHFCVPSKPGISGPLAPVVNLSPEAKSNGGRLQGGQTYYYAVAAEDVSGSHSPLSFLVRCDIPGTGSTYSVALKGIRSTGDVARLHLYRGTSPAGLFRVKTYDDAQQLIELIDDGEITSPGIPPDPSYDHANFYWRFEYSAECVVGAATGTTISSDSLRLGEVEAVGRTVRLTAGVGAGQEREITGHTENSITVGQAWAQVPNTTSKFVICDATWIPAAHAQQSPATFSVPNRAGRIVQVTGRAANVDGRETSAELSPITRHTIGGASEVRDVPPAPVFAVSTDMRGSLEIVGIGFTQTEDIATITAGTLVVVFLDELSSDARLLLSEFDSSASTCAISGLTGCRTNDLLQIGREIVRVLDVEGPNLSVERGFAGSEAATHATAASVYRLQHRTEILPFVKDHFASSAAAFYKHSLLLPYARVALVMLAMSNRKGQGQFGSRCLTDSAENGLRTHAGGQLILQVEGPLAASSSAASAITMDRNRKIRDVTASLNNAVAEGEVRACLTVDGNRFCDLAFEPGDSSVTIDGFDLPALAENCSLGLEIITIYDRLPQNTTMTIRVRF